MKTLWIIPALALVFLAGSEPAFSQPKMKATPLVWEGSGGVQITPVHGRRGFGRHFRGHRHGRFGYGPRWGGRFRYGPRWRSGFYWGFSAPLFVPRYVPPPVPYYYLEGVPYQRNGDHCSTILNYAERRAVPPGWAVDQFNREVEACREARYPTAPSGTVPSPPATSMNSTILSDDLACRNLAYQASRGGPGPDKTVEGGLAGGLLGAAAGAAIGAIAGDPGAGAAIGAVAGGVGGAVVKNEQADSDFYRVHANCMANRGHAPLP